MAQGSLSELHSGTELDVIEVPRVPPVELAVLEQKCPHYGPSERRIRHFEFMMQQLRAEGVQVSLDVIDSITLFREIKGVDVAAGFS